MADIVIADASTGQTTTRPLTAEEQAQRQADIDAAAQTQAAADAETTTRATLNTRLDDALVDLRTITATSGTLTTAQLSSAVRVIARVCIGLVRLTRRRLDGTD